MSCGIFWIIRRLLYLIRSVKRGACRFPFTATRSDVCPDIFVENIKWRALDSHIFKGLFVSTNMLDMNGYTYDTQMTQGNYTGVDLILSKGINLIQTDHPQLLDTYLKQRGKR